MLLLSFLIRILFIVTLMYFWVVVLLDTSIKLEVKSSASRCKFFEMEPRFPHAIM